MIAQLGQPHPTVTDDEMAAVTKLIVCALEGRPEREFLAAKIRRAYGHRDAARRQEPPDVA